MLDFQYKSATKIVFGKGKENEVGKHLKEHGSKILLHHPGGVLEELGVIERVKKSLSENNIEYVELSGVVPNPRLSLVYEGIDICKKENIDMILAVGGGSAIDSSKAIAMGAVYDGDVWDFFAGKSEPKEALKIATILTIPGSGSEMSESSIISNEELKLKSGVDSPVIVPEFSILNPEMCQTIPKRLLAAGIADILSHLLERYFTPTKGLYLSDYLLEGAMKSIMEVGPKLLEDPKNYDLCSEFMWTATVSHNGILDTGRASDWGSHRIEHEISAFYDVTHGAGMAIIFPAWMKYVMNKDIERFARMATNVFDIEKTNKSSEELAKEGISAMEEFFKSLGLSTSLIESEIPCDRFEEMAAKAVGSAGHVGRFMEITKDDIVNILELAK